LKIIFYTNSYPERWRDWPCEASATPDYVRKVLIPTELTLWEIRGRF
jgi:hypothetical protein